jgi:hypothetical protein
MTGTLRATDFVKPIEAWPVLGDRLPLRAVFPAAALDVGCKIGRHINGGLMADQECEAALRLP